MVKISNRIVTLEKQISARAARGRLPWCERAPWRVVRERWQDARKDGLELDLNSGRVMTFDELAQADPERADQLALRRRQVAEIIAAFEGEG